MCSMGLEDSQFKFCVQILPKSFFEAIGVLNMNGVNKKMKIASKPRARKNDADLAREMIEEDKKKGSL